MLTRAHGMPLAPWLAVALLCASMGSSASYAAAGDSRLEVGATFGKSMDLAGQDTTIPLPDGQWTVTGLIKDVNQPGGDYVSGILTRTEGGRVTGLTWFRSTNQRDFQSIADWCDHTGARHDVEPMKIDGVEQACRWLRTWNTRPDTAGFDEEWRSTFDSLEERGVALPDGMTTAGFHVADGKRLQTVEYSFDSAEVSMAQIGRWARAWQDYMAAAAKRQLAEMPEPRPSPLD